MGKINYWEKWEETDKVWWKYTPDTIGVFIFSFDKKKEFNFWSDYPEKLTQEEKAIFDKENPELAKLKNYWNKVGKKPRILGD